MSKPDSPIWPEDNYWPEDESTKPLTFKLGLEFEGWEPNEFELIGISYFIMWVTLSNNKEYCINVGTYKLLDWTLTNNIKRGDNLGGKYLLPPDLLVERADRVMLEQVVAEMVKRHELKEEWLCDNFRD